LGTDGNIHHALGAVQYVKRWGILEVYSSGIVGALICDTGSGKVIPSVSGKVVV
jgi:hypothetical protein